MISQTKQSQYSAIDYQSKAETAFLEKYLKIIFRDTLATQIIEHPILALHHFKIKKLNNQVVQFYTNQIRNTNEEHYNYFILETMSKSSQLWQTFITHLDSTLYSIDNATINRTQYKFYNHNSRLSVVDQKSQSFSSFLLYTNASNMENYQAGQIIFMDCKIKISNQKLQEYFKTTFQNIYNLLNQQENDYHGQYMQTYKMKNIGFTLFFNGDINNDFRNILNKYQRIQTSQGIYQVTIFIYYISKQALIQYFKIQNKQRNIYCIDDKIVTMWEVNRISQRRTKILKKIEKIKNDSKQQTSDTLKRAASLVGVMMVTLIGINVIRKKIGMK